MDNSFWNNIFYYGNIKFTIHNTGLWQMFADQATLKRILCTKS